MMILLEQQKTELREKDKQLEEKERLLRERDTQIMKREKQVEEKDRLLEERNKQLQERTDPDPSAPVRRRNSKDCNPPDMSGETPDSAASLRRRNSQEGLPPTMSGEWCSAVSPASGPAAELRLVLLGRTGCGKSAAGNSILGREERSQAGASTVRQQSESRQGEVAGRQVTVVETPDCFCPGLSLEELRQNVEHCVRLSAPGPHAFLLVLPVKQSTGEERGMLEKMEEMFGERCWRNTMILFTVTDEVQEKNIEEFIQSGNQEVQRLVEKCGNRFHCLNIKESGDDSQISELLEKIEKMVEENREKFYSSEIYLETQSQIRAMETKIIREREEKRMMEEREIKEKLEKEMKNSLRKIEGTVQEHEGEIKQLNNRTTELERRMKEERDEEKKRELEQELERELERRTEMKEKVKRLKEKREKEEREIEDRYIQELEEIMETYEEEARITVERNQKNFVFEKEYQKEGESGGVLKKWLFTKKDQGVKSEEDLSGVFKSKTSYTDAAELLSADTKLFIPEETEVTSGDGTTTFYRFQCPRAGRFQCKITSLVFEMRGKGEVLYRIVSWDTRLLDGLGQMQPAGPLYDIDCKGLISHLYLPHCEILSDESQQTVAHFTAGNVEIIPPLRVTTTHVIIRIQGLSLFGLLRNLFPANPISGQVLLFHKKLSVRQRMSKLNIHLLPSNVPVEEVMKKHPSSKYIDTSSKCQLTPGRKYRPSCDPYISQPEDETFECDYGPNYHPTFEVFLDIDAEDAKIGLLDEDEQEVWKPRLVFLTDISAQGLKLQTEAEWAAFVDDHREQLIQRLSSVMEILDCLEKQKMISKEMYDNIKVTKPPQEQMRMLYNVLHSGGRAVKVEFYKILKKKQQLLVDELEAGPSQA